MMSCHLNCDATTFRIQSGQFRTISSVKNFFDRHHAAGHIPAGLSAALDLVGGTLTSCVHQLNDYYDDNGRM